MLKESFYKVTDKYLWMCLLQKNSDESRCTGDKRLAVSCIIVED